MMTGSVSQRSLSNHKIDSLRVLIAHYDTFEEVRRMGRWPYTRVPKLSMAVNPTPIDKYGIVSGPNPFMAQSTNMATIGEQLKAAKAQIADARKAAADAVVASSESSRVVLQEVEKTLKEAADLRAEVAELTNGGPE